MVQPPTAARTAKSKRVLCVVLFDITAGMFILIRTFMTVIRVLVQGERGDTLFISYPGPDTGRVLCVLALLALGLYLIGTGWRLRQCTPTRMRWGMAIHSGGFVAVLAGIFVFPQTFSFNTPLSGNTAIALALGAGCFAMGFLCLDLLRHPPVAAAVDPAEGPASPGTTSGMGATQLEKDWSPAAIPGDQPRHLHRNPHQRPAKIRGAGLAFFDLIMGGLALLFFSGSLLNQYAHDQRMRDQYMEQYVSLDYKTLLFYAALFIGSLGLILASLGILRRAPRAHGWAALANWFFLILLVWPIFGTGGYWMVLAYAPLFALIHFVIIAAFLGGGIRAFVLLRKPRTAPPRPRVHLKDEIEVAPGWDEGNRRESQRSNADPEAPPGPELPPQQ